MTLSRSVLAVLALAVVSGGAPAAFAAKPPRKDCIYRREISTMRVVDNKHVYIKASASRHYLLTMDARCQGLDDARKIGVVESSPRVCGDGTSLLAFEDTMAGPMQCRIATIEQVKSLADAEELAAAEVRASPEP